jgi:hypothetical protein
MYRLTYDSGAGITVWEKTLDELLAPNGSETLLDWMLRESEAQGRGTFVLERVLA